VVRAAVANGFVGIDLLGALGVEILLDCPLGPHGSTLQQRPQLFPRCRLAAD